MSSASARLSRLNPGGWARIRQHKWAKIHGHSQEHHGALASVGAAVEGVGAVEGPELLGQRHRLSDDATEQGKRRHGEGDGAGGVEAVGAGLRAVGVDGAVGHLAGEVGIDRAALEQVDEVGGGDEPEAEARVDIGTFGGGWVRHGWARPWGWM